MFKDNGFKAMESMGVGERKRHMQRGSVAENRVARMALMTDNPSLSSLNDIQKYVKKLDKRLSIPKISKV